MSTNRQENVRTATPAIDIDALCNRCLGRMALVERMLSVFLDTAERDLTELESLIATGSRAQVDSMAHRLKGMALTVSANRMAQSADELQLAAQANGTDLSQHLTQMRQEVERVRVQAGVHAAGAY